MAFIFSLNLLYCIIGIILFIIFVIKNKVTFSKKYLLLIPSIVISILLIFAIILAILSNTTLLGMEILILLFATGSPLFLFYYVNQKTI